MNPNLELLARELKLCMVEQLPLLERLKVRLLNRSWRNLLDGQFPYFKALQLLRDVNWWSAAAAPPCETALEDYVTWTGNEYPMGGISCCRAGINDWDRQRVWVRLQLNDGYIHKHLICSYTLHLLQGGFDHGVWQLMWNPVPVIPKHFEPMRKFMKELPWIDPYDLNLYSAKNIVDRTLGSSWTAEGAEALFVGLAGTADYRSAMKIFVGDATSQQWRTLAHFPALCWDQSLFIVVRIPDGSFTVDFTAITTD